MIVSDEAVWQKQLAALEGDEIGREFRTFLATWMDRTEALLVSNPEDVMGCLRDALKSTEADLGCWPPNILGQMLVMIVGHWINGEEVLDGLTSIEYRLFASALLAKMEELDRIAREVS